jgi:hypothetical protein
MERKKGLENRTVTFMRCVFHFSKPRRSARRLRLWLIRVYSANQPWQTQSEKMRNPSSLSCDEEEESSC